MSAGATAGSDGRHDLGHAAPPPGEARPVPSRRLFVACDLPDHVAAAVGAWQDAELAPRADLRVAPTLHLTLCFLGDVAESRLDDLTAALGELVLPALPTAFAEPLFLPPRGAKRVVALRLDDPNGALSHTQAAVADALAGHGLYTPERRPFLPHLTVARYRRPGHPFPLQNVNIGAFGLPSVILYASLLERAGAVHTPLASFPAKVLPERSAPRG
jgi:2'-5' RNA ligase